MLSDMLQSRLICKNGRAHRVEEVEQPRQTQLQLCYIVSVKATSHADGTTWPKFSQFTSLFFLEVIIDSTSIIIYY